MELKIFGFFLEKYLVFLTFYLVSYLLLTESTSTFKEFANFSKVDLLCQKLSSNSLISGVALRINRAI